MVNAERLELDSSIRSTHNAGPLRRAPFGGTDSDHCPGKVIAKPRLEPERSGDRHIREAGLCTPYARHVASESRLFGH